MKIEYKKICLIGLIILLMSLSLQANEYKTYKYSRHQKEYFEITYDKANITVKTFDDTLSKLITFTKKDIHIKDNVVYAKETALFDQEGLIVNGKHYYYRLISDTRILDDEHSITITFLTQDPDYPRVSRIKKGNIITFQKPITVTEGQFIRGVIISIIAPVEIYGEVNKDIISLFGNVYVGSDAVARGDITSITGKINIARKASVYGEIYSFKKGNIRRTHRFVRYANSLDFSGFFKYNRVDGFTAYAQVKYVDADSLLPTFWATEGYGFSSKRWRYDFGAEQTLLRNPLISVGGSLYQRLASGDDWLLSDNENTAFALLASKDFKDYYEAEGGTIYFKFKPYQHLNYESRYRYEQTSWLNAKTHLWSLFGYNDLFRENFSSVNNNFRQRGIKEIDTTTNAYWYNRLEWDTRSPKNPFSYSAWHITADFEWSLKDVKSDFDYRRYTLSVIRYQKVHHQSLVIIRGIFGESDGYLPMYKRFFLGGLGTMRGYKHKEYMGTRYWMINSIYRLNFPKADIILSLFWDIAQIANDTKFNNSIDVKNDIGMAVNIGEDFQVSLTKRLDRSYNDIPKTYVRLAKSW